ncbi:MULTISPECIES: DUF4365 domain-containing protein [unclassified Sediminibacterium]|uniref:DUF4365 domain-containing protein n=1 Tax=unclassified Sediminibacterium TaxID=2635961 RepID=UPI00041F5B0B|nr:MULTISPECIES: DUF4365 domain-containing protein [unclassified Sediminibacterium]MDP3392721.1 DUF4365 domain-containing protein [Sediminibacterium sp.]MDP3566036.1 DUF4365 domain-containing protein [Sediminibacterium sp.]
MAFNQLPVIDASSKNSETSTRRMNEQINLKTGFNCRPQVPDTGIDYEVELVINKTQASAWQFPIQLKSIAGQFERVKNDAFISYSFETSRLGYLMRRLPARGLIVLYSDSENILLFDYVDRIYERLMEERISDEWKNNNKVSINIPASNILDPKAVHQIHQVFVQLFEQNERMHRDHGSKYKLPLGDLTASQTDLYSIEDIKAILLKHGMSFLNSYDIRIVYRLLSKLTHQQILEDDKLLVMAVVVYAEFGQYAESLMYFNKLNKRNPQLVESEITLQFSKLKSDLSLANITQDEFDIRLKKLGENASGGIDKITIDINSIFYELLAVKSFHPMPEDLSSKIEKLFNDIEASRQPEDIKCMLELWNTENLMILFNGIRHRAFSEVRIMETLGRSFTMQERLEKVTLLIEQEKEYTNRLDGLNKYAKANDKKLLLAHVWALNNRGTYSKQLDYYTFQPVRETIKISKELIFNNIILGLQAYNLFMELDHLMEAYHSLCTSIELIDVSRKFLDYTDPIDREDLLGKKQLLEQQFDGVPYELSAEKLAEKIKVHEPINYHPDSMDFLKDFDDLQMETLARITMNATHLQESSLSFIIDEMKGYRTFFNSNATGKLLILQSPSNVGPNGERYQSPIRFILKSRETGLESSEATDVAKLLSDWGYQTSVVNKE